MTHTMPMALVTPVLLLASCLALGACSAPKTRKELMALPMPETRVCSGTLSPGEAVERLRFAWLNCFVKAADVGIFVSGGNAIAYRGGVIELLQEQTEGAFVLTSRIASQRTIPNPLTHGILLMADVRETPACQAEVVVRPVNDHWQRRAEMTADWLNDPRSNPPMARCDR